MKTIRDIVTDNLPWVITAILTIGIFAATVKYQGESLIETNKQLTIDHARLEKAEAQLQTHVEVSMEKLSRIQSDIHEIKQDLKDVKQIVLKPAIAYEEFYLEPTRTNSFIALK